MNQQINFEDNLFVTINMVRIIHDTCVLDIAPEFFLQKIMYDLDFIDQTLGLLLTRLIGNIHLVNRNEHLDNFSAVEKEYENVLTQLINGSGTVCKAAALIPDIKSKISALQDNSRSRSLAIKEAFKVNKEEYNDPLVTLEEYNELLK